MAAEQQGHIYDITTSLAAALTVGTTPGWSGKCQVTTIHVGSQHTAETWFRLVLTRSGGADKVLFEREPISAKRFFHLTTKLTLYTGDALKMVGGDASGVLTAVFDGFSGVA